MRADDLCKIATSPDEECTGRRMSRGPVGDIALGEEYRHNEDDRQKSDGSATTGYESSTPEAGPMADRTHRRVGRTMIRPIEVEAREGYRIWLRYSDGSSGEIDLSHLAGRGVFAAWDEPGRFQQVRGSAQSDYVGRGHRALPRRAYMQLTGLEQIPLD